MRSVYGGIKPYPPSPRSCYVCPMDRASLYEHLAQAERGVSECERHIARQRENIIKLQPGGHEAREATSLLHDLVELLGMLIVARDRMRRQLAN